MVISRATKQQAAEKVMVIEDHRLNNAWKLPISRVSFVVCRVHDCWSSLKKT